MNLGTFMTASAPRTRFETSLGVPNSLVQGYEFQIGSNSVDLATGRSGQGLGVDGGFAWVPPSRRGDCLVDSSGVRA